MRPAQPPRPAGPRAAPAGLLLEGAGGYRYRFTASRAGEFGCDHCWGCEQRPAAGEIVWQNCYGDLYCDPCAQRRVVGADA
jgi:hypothetical protein